MAGIGESTLRGYLQEPEFQSRYQQAINPALSTLREIMEDGDEQAQARITAARSVLEYAIKLTEQTDVLEQLRELEKWRDETDGNR